MSSVFMSIVFVSVVLSPAAFASESPRSVSVSGGCTRNVMPDRGAIIITIDSKDADAKRAQSHAARQYEAVRAEVANLKLADGEISTVEYQSEEIREWVKDRQVSKGFHTRMGLRVETSEYLRMGEVIEIASREGIKNVEGLQFFVSTKKMMGEKMTCLKEASEQARAKAEALARALNAKVGEVLTIQESVGQESPPEPHRVPGLMANAAAVRTAPQVEPGKIEMMTTVSVTFSLK